MSNTEVVKQWKDWLNNKQTLTNQWEDAERQLTPLREKMDSAQKTENKAFRLAAQDLHMDYISIEDDAGRIRVLNSLKKATKGELEEATISKTSAAEHFKEVSQAQKKRQVAQKALNDANKAFIDARDKLAIVEQEKPPVSTEALQGIEQLMEECRQQSAEIGSTIHRLESRPDNRSELSERLKAAQQAVDDARAAHALGKASVDDVAKAEAECQKAGDQLNEQVHHSSTAASTVRGLKNQQAELSSRLASLAEIHRQVTGEVGQQKLAAAEQKLVDFLGQEKITKLVHEVNQARSMVNPVLPPGHFQKNLKLTISLPLLYTVKGMDTINHQ